MVKPLYDRHERKKTIDSLLKIGVHMQEINKVYHFIREKYAPLKPYDPEKINRKAIYREIADVMKEVYSNEKSNTYDFEILKGQNIPKIFEGERPLTGKAKYINHIYSQNRRGCYRYVFNPSTKKMLGIAYHPNGENANYKWELKFS